MLYYGSLRFSSGRQIGLVRQERNRAFSQLLLLPTTITTLSRLSSACKIEAGTYSESAPRAPSEYDDFNGVAAAVVALLLLTVASVSGRSTDLQLPCRVVSVIILSIQLWEE